MYIYCTGAETHSIKISVDFFFIAWNIGWNNQELGWTTNESMLQPFIRRITLTNT